MTDYILICSFCNKQVDTIAKTGLKPPVSQICKSCWEKIGEGFKEIG